MVKMVVYAAMMGVFFAGGLGVSVALLRARADAEEHGADAQGAATAAATSADSHDALDAASSHGDIAGQDALAVSHAAPAGDHAEPAAGNDLPIAVRGRPMSPEEIYRYGELFKQQMAQLKQREEELQQKANRLAIMQADLENSKRELDGMRQEINDAVTAGEQLLSEILQHRAAIQQQQDQQPETAAEQDIALSPEEEAANIKRMVALFQAMPPETAGQYITELVHNGDIDTPARLLAKIEDRNAAKIIAELDNAVGLKILEEVKRQRHPEKETKTR